jgi:hypothetical protein
VAIWGEASSAFGMRRGICLAGSPSRSDPWWHYRALKARAVDSKPRSPGFKFRGTNLDSFEANSTLELDTSLHLGSPNHELSFEILFFIQTNWFSLQYGAM